MTAAVVVTSDSTLTARLAAMLDGVALVAAVQPAAEAVELIVKELNPRVVFIDMEDMAASERLLATLLGAIRRLKPEQYVIALGDMHAPDKILAAIRAGVNDYLDARRAADELRERSMTHLKAAASPATSEPGSIVMILSGRPNDGESFVAMHLAAARAKDRHDGGETVLVDFNLPISECETAFNVALNYTIADAVSDLARLDRTLLASALPRDEGTGLYFLPLAASAKALSLPAAGTLAQLFDALGSAFGDVVVNLGCLRHSDMLAEILPLASRLVVVTTQSLSAIRCCSEVLRAARARGVAAERDILVVSDVYRGVEPGPDKIGQALEVAHAVALPPEKILLLNCLNEGILPMTAHPASAYARAIEQLAAEIYRGDAPVVPARHETARKVRRWLGTLRCVLP